MLNPGQYIADNGHLYIAGCDAEALANKYGTPLYVMNEDVIRNNCRSFLSAINKYFDGKGRAYYASKAFSCLEIYRITNEEKIGVDVVSGGELYTALKAGFPAERINFHGNNKILSELKMAVENNVGLIIVDNLTELDVLDRIAETFGKVVNIALRIKPGVEAHTHEYIKTGQIDSKFGFAIENGEADEAVSKAVKCQNLKLTALHCHIGSQIFDVEPFVDAASIMMDYIKSITIKYNVTVGELNLGGGFGIKYIDSDTPLSFDNHLEPVAEMIKNKAAELDIDMPIISFEPGRSIVGDAGVTLYTVGGIKDIPDVRTYISIDGGMGDNIRYALYQAEYTVINAIRGNLPNDMVATIAGRCCESGDLIQENVCLPKTKVGDVLAVLSTGAYNYSMASNYNRIPRPAVVMVSNGYSRVVVQRESYDDIISNDI